jgi:hypothetical protein
MLIKTRSFLLNINWLISCLENFEPTNKGKLWIWISHRKGLTAGFAEIFLDFYSNDLICRSKTSRFSPVFSRRFKCKTKIVSLRSILILSSHTLTSLPCDLFPSDIL